MTSLGAMNRADPLNGLFSLDGIKRFAIASAINGIAYQVLNSLEFVSLGADNEVVAALKMGGAYAGVQEAASLTGFSYNGGPGPLVSGNVMAFVDNAAYNAVGLFALYKAGLEQMIRDVLRTVPDLPMLPYDAIVQGVLIEVIRAMRDAVGIMIRNGTIPQTAMYILRPASALSSMAGR